MTNTPRRFDENPNTTTNLQKDSTEYFGISQSGASKVIKTSDAFTKANVGLSEVDNTSDANKPVSVAQQTALDLKADKSESLALGEVTGTAYDGAKGKANADNIQDLDTNKADKSDTYTKSEVNTLNDAQDVNIITNADNIAIVDGRQNVLLDNKVVNGGDEVSSGVGAYGLNLGDSFLLQTGSVYYVQVQTKYTTINEIPTSLLLTFSGGIISWHKYSPAENTYYKISGNYTSLSTNTKILAIYATPSNAIDGVTTYAKEGMVLNLTDIFCDGVTGTGKEPNAKLMQKFIEQTGYFTIHTMTNKEIALAYSEYLKDIDTAITELGGTI